MPTLVAKLLVIDLDLEALRPYASVVPEPRQDGDDWDAVAKAVNDRLSDMRMTQMDVASRAQVSLTTVRELQHNSNPRKRRPQTLSTISEALGWPSAYLAEVLAGRTPAAHADELSDPVLTSLKALEREVGALRDRVGEIERQIGREGAQP